MLRLGLLTVLFCSCAAASERPNVLIVMTDDQGKGDFSIHGNPALKTPHLDRLATDSIRFTDFHVAPMCTPTRGQLMSGLDAVRNGATSVTGGRSFMRTGIPTLPQLLRDAGYRTGLFGKWHLGDHYPHRPMDRGFDQAVWHRGCWGFTSAPEYANTLFDGRYLEQDQLRSFSKVIAPTSGLIGLSNGCNNASEINNLSFVTCLSTLPMHRMWSQIPMRPLIATKVPHLSLA